MGPNALNSVHRSPGPLQLHLWEGFNGNGREGGEMGKAAIVLQYTVIGYSIY